MIKGVIMRKTTPVHICRVVQDAVKGVSETTHIPQRHLIEKAIVQFLEKEHPNHYNLLVEKKNEEK